MKRVFETEECEVWEGVRSSEDFFLNFQVKMQGFMHFYCEKN